jgi:hypothetical protein
MLKNCGLMVVSWKEISVRFFHENRENKLKKMKRNFGMREMVKEKKGVCFSHESIGIKLVADNFTGLLLPKN